MSMDPAATTFGAHLSPAARRRWGSALLGFGVIGLIILAILGFLVLGPLGSLGSAAASLDDQRTRLVAMLPSAGAALDSAATAATNAGASLRASGQSARDGSTLLVQLASAMDGMSAASKVNILGQEPFGTLSDELTNVAARSRSLATDLSSAADGLDANVTDSNAAAARLHELSGRLATLRSELESGNAAGGASNLTLEITILRLLLLALLVWLAVPAVAAAWLGWLWRRPSVAVDKARDINQS